MNCIRLPYSIYTTEKVTMSTLRAKLIYDEKSEKYIQVKQNSIIIYLMIIELMFDEF